MRLAAQIAAAWVALFFANGRFAIAAAAWVGPFLLLRVLRQVRGPRGLALAYALLVSVTLAQWWGVWGPLRGPVVYGGVALGAVLLLAPYAVDRALAAERASFTRTLVFPCAFVSAELLFALAIANEGSLGYTQVRVLPLLQLASITGVFGLTFLVAWCGSVASWRSIGGPHAARSRRASRSTRRRCSACSPSDRRDSTRSIAPGTRGSASPRSRSTTRRPGGRRAPGRRTRCRSSD